MKVELSDFYNKNLEFVENFIKYNMKQEFDKMIKN